MPPSQQLAIQEDEIARFCQRWQIVEFALFGSVLRDDFNAESDIDVLVAFAPDAAYSFKQIVAMHEELESLLGRSVDLLDKDAVRQNPNYIRRKAILDSVEVVYA